MNGRPPQSSLRRRLRRSSPTDTIASTPAPGSGMLDAVVPPDETSPGASASYSASRITPNVGSYATDTGTPSPMPEFVG
jgi:hypothetical protein